LNDQFDIDDLNDTLNMQQSQQKQLFQSQLDAKVQNFRSEMIIVLY